MGIATRARTDVLSRLVAFGPTEPARRLPLRLDVGSIEFIHKHIIEQRDAGAAVLLVLAELDEVMSVSDRIAVMYRGKIIATVDAKTATRAQLGLLMAGVAPEQVAQELADSKAAGESDEPILIT